MNNFGNSLLSRLSSDYAAKPLAPRDIFMSLPNREQAYQYPRDVQTEVWTKWYDVRNNKNTIIKMNTGSGKTVVGLTILQSCINEKVAPAVYVVPDNYLVNQVLAEASKLGISVTDDRDDYRYNEGSSILVTNIDALVNGHSVFGMRSDNNYPIGSIIIDDVHACIDKIASKFSVRIPCNHELYGKIASVFKEDIRNYDYKDYINLFEQKDPKTEHLIPFWTWQEKIGKVYSLLQEYNDNLSDFVYFTLPLIKDYLKFCNCIISTREIEITPLGIAIEKIQGFQNAKRRIMMSATLADDSVFVSSLGLPLDDISNIITPDCANDIGDRLILFPRYINSNITDDEIRAKVLQYTDQYNVAVIVPSWIQALKWDPTGQNTVKAENIYERVAQLKQQHVGLTVFVNRYDGIDLPANACRMLVIDGVPPFRSMYEKRVSSIIPGSSLVLREKIQKVEQGMGRGVRSPKDSCCVVLMGDELADMIGRARGTKYFSKATQEQFELSKKLWELLLDDNSKPTVENVFLLAEYSLKCDPQWTQFCKSALNNVKYVDNPNIDEVSLAVRRAFDYVQNMQFDEAIAVLNDEYNRTDNDHVKAYLLQVEATYLNAIDKVKAQEKIKCARTLSGGVLSPILGIRYSRKLNSNPQAKNIVNFLISSKMNQNELLIYFDSIASKLTFNSGYNEFEDGIERIGELIGFISSRPDKETNGKGPDNLWAYGDNIYAVIECKNKAVSEKISKEYCNQLNGDANWFAEQYGNVCSCELYMVYRDCLIDDKAAPDPNIRIITENGLQRFKQSVRGFVQEIVQSENWMVQENITKILTTHKLRGTDIRNNYSEQWRRV